MRATTSDIDHTKNVLQYDPGTAMSDQSITMDKVKKVPNPIDRHVGSRVRMRRVILGMSQEKLGEALGLTFQQVQKYEKGANRIGASRLQQISRTLDVPPAFFFEGAPSLRATGTPKPALWEYARTQARAMSPISCLPPKGSISTWPSRASMTRRCANASSISYRRWPATKRAPRRGRAVRTAAICTAEGPPSFDLTNGAGHFCLTKRTWC